MRRLGRLSLLASIVGLVLSVAVALSTLLPGAPVLPEWAAYVLLPLALLVNVRTAWIGVQLRRVPGVGLPGVPSVAKVAFVAWFVFAGTLAYISLTEARGQPTVFHGRYYLNDHGRYLLVNHAEYLHAQVVEQRNFSLIPGILLALGALAGLVKMDGPLAQASASRWRSRRWWMPVASLAIVYGVTATLAWGWRAGTFVDSRGRGDDARRPTVLPLPLGTGAGTSEDANGDPGGPSTEPTGAGTLAAAHAETRSRPNIGGVLGIMGSGELTGSLMAAALIDEYLLRSHPLVLGSGRRLFPDGVELSLRLTEACPPPGASSSRPTSRSALAGTAVGEPGPLKPRTRLEPRRR